MAPRRTTWSARATCGRWRRRWAAKLPSWPTCRGRRSASANSPTARCCSKPASRSSWTRKCDSLGDAHRVGLDYKDLVRDVEPGAVLLLDDGLIRLDRPVDRRAAHRDARRRRRQAVEQQGHQPAGRRSVGARADREGHGRHQDRGRARRRLRRRVVPQVAARHADGARSAARRRQQRAPHRQDRARRGNPGAGRDHRRVRRHHGRAWRPCGRGRQRRGAGPAEADDPDGARAQQAHDHRDADDGIDDPARRCRRAPKSPTSPTRCWTAPTP